jgi:cephalosporin hydroxylase
MNPVEQFKAEVLERIAALGQDEGLKKLAIQWVFETLSKEYVYNFTWLGRPIIQMPQDTVALQELIWQVKPDLIIETGVAHGGSIIFSASILELIGGKSTVLGIDIDIRQHNRTEIENHPMYKRIKLLEGSSIDKKVVAQVKRLAKNKKRVMVFLDSYHTHAHVLEELRLYAPFVTKDSYLVAFDTWVEQMPPNYYPTKPWDKGDNPWTAVDAFLSENKDFTLDKSIEDKLLITLAPHGYLKRIH